MNPDNTEIILYFASNKNVQKKLEGKTKRKQS